ncbi:MAG: hypothetical protein LUQ38_00035 [Methanotrichaceae archaeon]|nr:hypothetical protein [Methanotrichaceae archaeon]
MVKRSNLLVVNVCAFFLLALQAFSGGWLYIAHLKKFVPPHAIIAVHPITGMGLIIIILFHMYLNRRWIAMQLKK